MEAFEKWKFENYFPDSNLVDSDDYQEGYSDGLEAGWEAALNFALLLQVSSWEQDGSISYSNCIHASDIKKELESK